MNKNLKKILFTLAVIFILLSNKSKLNLEKVDAISEKDTKTISAVSEKEELVPDKIDKTVNSRKYSPNVEEGIAPTKIYVYGIDLIEYYAIKDTSLIKDLGMFFWTTNVGRLSENYIQRLYFTTKPISQEMANRYEIYKYFIFVGDMPAPLFVAHEHIEGYPSVYYVTDNPNEIVDSLIPVVNCNSKTNLAYDTNTKEKYLVSDSDAEKIRSGEIPGQELIGLYGRDAAYKDMLDDVFDDMSIFNSLSLEKYRNDQCPETEDFFESFKDIYNNRA